MGGSLMPAQLFMVTATNNLSNNFHFSTIGHKLPPNDLLAVWRIVSKPIIFLGSSVLAACDRGLFQSSDNGRLRQFNLVSDLIHSKAILGVEICYFLGFCFFWNDAKFNDVN